MRKSLFLAVLPLVLSLGACQGEIKTCQSIDRTCNILPYPQEFEQNDGGLYLNGAHISVAEQFGDASEAKISAFARTLSTCTGSRIRVRTGCKEIPAGTALAFVYDPELGDEAYDIKVDASGAVVKASAYNGVLYALATLRQLLPVEVYEARTNADVEWTLPFCTVEDAPAYPYRGVMLDCSRHFWTVEEVEKFLDIMAEFKLNRFHWHLTDDQGWRVEIKKYPKLTEIGCTRSGSQIGWDKNTNDHVPHGGFYTQDDLRRVVAYAQNLGITIVPEIDLPGHMVAALASYPELGCTGGPYEVRTSWGIADEVLCAGKDATYEFLDEVLNELADIFPGELFHIGGDECPKTAWENCPACQAKIAELGLVDTEKGTAEMYLQNYVTHHVKETLEAKGKKIIGWGEITEGDLDKDVMVHYWRAWLPLEETLYKYTAEGYDVVMSPTYFFYLDYIQSENRDEEPFGYGYGKSLTIEKMYSFDQTKELSAEQKSHVKGVQANLWTEYVCDWSHAEYMLLPRMFALCCINWTGEDRPDFDTFIKDVRSHEFPVLDALGYNYRNK